MKKLVSFSRILVGGLFVFSGLVKAIDPLGLSYKMMEFFEAWGLDKTFPSLADWSDFFSMSMITLEVVLGVALLVGWWRKLTLFLLLLLMLLFTFLTSYVLFSGKIRACGCFGDCIPLTPVQTFTKDIILLVLVLVLMAGQKHIEPLLGKISTFSIVLASLAGVIFLQLHVLVHLPLKDCLPYKKGNDILKLRQMPEGAIPDKYEYVFVYEKGGVKKEFGMNGLPDSTWTFVDRKQTLVQKGKNNVPLINDFSLKDSAGVDQTEMILSQQNEYYLFFIKNMKEGTVRWSTAFVDLWKKSGEKKIPLYIVTADPDNAQTFFNRTNQYNVPVFTCDVVAIKTAARANPTIFLMKGPVVQEKVSAADVGKLLAK